MKINDIAVIEDFIPKSNKTSRPGYPMIPKYITIHNTGNSKKGADADMHTEYVDTATGYVSWHFTVDDNSIYQELPTNESAWHAGDGANGTGNRQSIGIEICENTGGDYEKAEENAIALIVYLMNKHNIPIENVVPHQKWSGKYCPHKILDYGWDKFIDKIRNYGKLPSLTSRANVEYEGKVIPAYLNSEGRTLVEVRSLAIAQDLDIAWDGKTKTTKLKRRG